MNCKICGCNLNYFTAEVDNKFCGWYCSKCNPYKPKNHMMKLATKGTDSFTKKEIIFVSILVILTLFMITLLILILGGMIKQFIGYI